MYYSYMNTHIPQDQPLPGAPEHGAQGHLKMGVELWVTTAAGAWPRPLVVRH